MISRYKPLFLSLSFLTLYALTIVFAVPPLTQYTPGETLDPSCAPGDTNCGVFLDVSPLKRVGNSYISELSGPGGMATSEGTSSGLKNVVIGTDSFLSNQTGFRNVVLGPDVLQGAVAQEESVLIGSYAGKLLGSGIRNVGIGHGTLGGSHAPTISPLPSGSYNTAIGIWSLGNISNSASNNTAMGIGSMQNTVNGANFNVALGHYAGNWTDEGDSNVFIGTNAGSSSSGSRFTGSFNVVIGAGTMVPNRASGGQLNIGNVLWASGLRQSNSVSSTPSTDGAVSIGVNTPEPTALLTLASTTRGLLIPRMTTVQRDAIITPATGLQIYNTTTNQFNFWTGSAWSPLVSGSAWSLTGNAGTNPSTDFIGTIDNQDVVIRRNNIQAARFFTDRVSIGEYAGNASTSNFIGPYAGFNATNANGSNFFGNSAGIGATSAQASNFLGSGAGFGATSAQASNFLGQNAGNGATGAAFSNFFGQEVGRAFAGNNIGSNNIIIGTNISLPNATANAINLGGVLFGTNTYATTTGNPSIVPVNTGRIGIATNTLNYTFQAGNNTVTGIVARFQNSTGTCDINPTTTSLVCSSDETLKSNITSLENALSSITSLRPVTYTWNTDTTNTQQIGFIAQEVEHVFPNLVFTDPTTGLKSLAYTNLIPYTISALQDINLSLTTLDDTQTPNVFRDAIVRLLESATNGLQRIFVKEVETEELCISNNNKRICVNADQLERLLSESVGDTPNEQPPTSLEESTDEEPVLPLLEESLEAIIKPLSEDTQNTVSENNAGEEVGE